MDTYQHIRLPIEEGFDDLGNPRSSPLASVNKRHVIMNQDFTRVQSMNALSTRPNFRRRSHKGPVLLLASLAAAATAYVIYIS